MHMVIKSKVLNQFRQKVIKKENQNITIWLQQPEKCEYSKFVNLTVIIIKVLIELWIFSIILKNDNNAEPAKDFDRISNWSN